MINCLIVDDEPIARKGLQEHIRQIDFLHLVAECKNAMEAASWLNKKNIDLIFLDIEMPQINGIEFLKSLPFIPLVIFTTAYPQYAIDGYELDVLDYLLKPISFNRFLKAALKAQEAMQKKNNNKALPVTQDFFFIKSNQKIEKINIADMLYAEAMSNYVIVHTRQKKHIIYITFKGLEEQLPQPLFIRIHKSFIVSINAIRTIDGNEIILESGSLPLSKSYKEEVMNRIGGLLFKR
jgi:DNA-binding LytR/AlgR family response regulator